MCVLMTVYNILVHNTALIIFLSAITAQMTSIGGVWEEWHSLLLSMSHNLPTCKI